MNNRQQNLTLNEKDDIKRLTNDKKTTTIPIILYLLTILLVGSIFFLIIDKNIVDNDIKLIARMAILCLIINVIIYTFISTSFSIVKIKPGLIGPKGLNGDKGDIGKSGKCSMCEPKSNTYGIIKHNKNANELVIPQKPLLTQIELKDNESGYYYIINKIFQELVGCREKIVATEAEALLLLDTIKSEMNELPNDRLPNESEIQRYLLQIKQKADKGNDNDKNINYPKCYGINYTS